MSTGGTISGGVGDVGMAQVKQRKSPTRRGRPPGSRYGAVFPLRVQNHDVSVGSPDEADLTGFFSMLSMSLN
jgi:hypothetical protein